jgi:hypothetical protein
MPPLFRGQAESKQIDVLNGPFINQLRKSPLPENESGDVAQW